MQNKSLAYPMDCSRIISILVKILIILLIDFKILLLKFQIFKVTLISCLKLGFIVVKILDRLFFLTLVGRKWTMQLIA